MSLADSPSQFAPISQLNCVTGYGSSDTHAIKLSNGNQNRNAAAGTPYDTVSFADICAMAASPPTTDKLQAQWIIPSEYAAHDARSHKAQREHGKYHSLAVDVDKESPTLAQVCEAVRLTLGNGYAFVIYSTRSSTADERKWRVLIPLAKPLAGKGYSAFQDALFQHLGQRGIKCDGTLARNGQLVFLPNRGTYYQHHIEGHALIDPTVHVLRETAERISAEWAKVKPGEGGFSNTGTIGWYNRHNEIEDVLERYGYEYSEANREWRSPMQRDGDSGRYSTKVTSQGGWMSLSGSDAEAGIGMEGKASRVGDAFAVYTHFEHGGDQNAAIAAMRTLHYAGLADEGKAFLAGIEVFGGAPFDYNLALGTLTCGDSVQGEVIDAPPPENMADAEPQPKARPAMPDHILIPDDPFGALVQAVYDAQRRPNKLTAFIGTTSFLMTVAGGFYQGMDKDDRLRLNFIVTGSSGSGKESAETGGGKLAQALINQTRNAPEPERIPHWIANRFVRPAGSPEGLEDNLLIEADLMVQWGEISQHLKDIANDKSHHRAGYLNLLVDLYAKADSPYMTRALANKPGEMIYAPHPMFVATSTEEKLADVISHDFLTDGTGARLLMFNADPYKEPNRRRAGDLKIPGEVVSAVVLIVGNAMSRKPEERVNNALPIPFDDAADDLFFSFSQKADALPNGSLESALMNRRAVQAKSIAMARGLLVGGVTLEIAEWAAYIVEFSDFYKMDLAKNHVSHGPADKARLKVVECLKDAGQASDGTFKWVPRRDLTQLGAMRAAAKANPSNAQGVLTALLDDGIIEHQTVKRLDGRGHTQKLYRYIPEV